MLAYGVPDEIILGFPTSLLKELGIFQGFSPNVKHYLPGILKALAVRPRSQAETDPSFKQLIPYVVFVSGEQVFHYVRGRRGSEKRLHELHSVGVGGHIQAADVSLFEDSYRVGMLRELDEEVELDPTVGSERIIGMLNDDSTEVGSVHFGIVHRWDLPAAQMRAREGHLLQAGFRPIAELRGEREHFETWSQCVLDNLGNNILDKKIGA